MAGGRLLPRRDEHRQHVDPGPDHRLRPVRLPRRLRSRPHLQPLRPRRAATPTRASRTSRYWNLLRAGAGAAAADRRTRRAMPRSRRWSRTRRVFPRALRVALRAKLGLHDAERRRPRTDRRPARAAWPPTVSTSRIIFRRLARFDSRRRRTTTPRARPVPRPRGLRRLGRALSPSGCAPKAAATPNAPRAMNRVNPQVRAAQPPGREGDPPGAGRRLRRGRSALLKVLRAAVRRTARACRAMPASRPTGRHRSRSPVHHEQLRSRQATQGDEERRRMARRSSNPLQYEVTRHAATERPFTGKYWDHCDRRPATTASAAARRCSSRTTKFDAGCGWPSYFGADQQRGDRARRSTRATAWCASKSAATTAARTWATCSRTGRSRPACATASTRPRIDFAPKTT